ncbi:MAG: NAD(P)H-dependent oxidoreductase subunit E [Thermoleophilaceae bacterium]|nr:NAD(P)H-dependent oxidoreductase subunit E [Thermoleophilaceae bacterium]
MSAARYEDAIPQLVDEQVPDALRVQIEEFMARYPQRESAAIPALMAAQKHHGWCSPQAIRQVAAVMQVTPAYLESVASFYDMFERTPRGEHTIYMCTNISCMMRGAQQVLEALEAAADVSAPGTSADGIFIREFECLGACDLAPIASVDGNYIGPLTPETATTLITNLKAGTPPLPHLTLGSSQRPGLREDSPGSPNPSGEPRGGAEGAPAVYGGEASAPTASGSQDGETDQT